MGHGNFIGKSRTSDLQTQLDNLPPSSAVTDFPLADLGVVSLPAEGCGEFLSELHGGERQERGRCFQATRASFARG